MSVRQAIEQTLQKQMERGLLAGAQVYLQQQGEEPLQVAIGRASEQAAMTADTVMPWLSAGKPIVAAAMGILWQRKQLQWTDAVAHYIPEFAAHGKGSITIEHLLTHTADLRAAASNFSLEPWEQLVARLCQARPEPHWVFGSDAGYNPAGGWIALGELIRRIDGRDFDRFVEEEIFVPLEMRDCAFALSPQQQAELGPRLGVMLRTEPPKPVRPCPWETPEHRNCPRPGATLRGPTAMLGRFYHMLLNGGRGSNGQEVLQRQTVEQLVARRRQGVMDKTFKQTIDWGLGFMLNSRRYGEHPYQFGTHSSEESFGHGGSQSSIAWADPRQRRVVAIVYNGMCGEQMHQGRMNELLESAGL